MYKRQAERNWEVQRAPWDARVFLEAAQAARQPQAAAPALAFSYPGYNEMSVGFPDPRIDRNEFGPNPNVTVFEWLNKLPEFSGHVAVYGTWAIYDDIFNLSLIHI